MGRFTLPLLNFLPLNRHDEVEKSTGARHERTAIMGMGKRTQDGIVVWGSLTSQRNTNVTWFRGKKGGEN